MLLNLTIAGCHRQLPILSPKGDKEFTSAIPFDKAPLVVRPPIELEKQSPEPSPDIINRAKQETVPPAGTPSMSLTLPEVRKYALENNLDLKVALYDPGIAKAGFISARSKFEAVLNTSLSDTISHDYTDALLRTMALTPTVTIPTQEGGTASITLPFTRLTGNQFYPGSRVPVGRLDSPTMTFGFTQPLLRGAGTGFNYASINIAGLQMRQTDARTKLAAIRVLANAEQAYWNLYNAHENLKIQIEQYDLSKEQLRTTQRLVEEGAKTKIEVTRAESDTARRFDGILVAENTRRRAELTLKAMMNEASLPLQSATIVIPMTEPDPEGLTFDRNRVIALALENRMEMLENELALAQDRITLSTNRNLILPDIRTTFNYSFLGSGLTFDHALNSLFNNASGYTTAVTASIPLGGNQTAKANALQSALTLSKDQASRRALEVSIRQDVLNAINAVELDWQRILSNRAAVARAQETYQDNRKEFELGKITTTELALTLDQVAEARSALVSSITEYQNSIVDLAFATGTVMGESSVNWTPRVTP
jgi:outer membrane protein TolC